MRNYIFRKVVITILFSTTLFASTYFDDGVDYFKNGNFNQAYEVFYKLSNNGNGEKELDFYLGRSAFEVKKFDEALFSFDRVMIEVDERDSDKINRIKLELARTHLALEEVETAKKLFQEVLDSSPPKIVEEKILSILNSYKKEKPKPKEWNFFINIETGYETNIDSQPSNENMSNYINNPEIKPDEKLSSLYIQEMANIGYSHIFEDNSFIFNANLFGFNQNYVENSDFDISYLSLGVVPVFKQKSYQVSIPFKSEYIEYGGKELLTAHSIGLKGSKFIETDFIKAIMFDIFGNYKIKDYTDKNSEQDSSVFKYGLAVTTKYQQHRFNFRYSTEYETAENETILKNTNITDKIINSISFKYDLKEVSNMFDLSFLYSFRNIVYDNYEAFTEINPAVSDGCRRDRYNSVKISFSKDIFMKNLNGEVGFNYIKNVSNHIPAEYNNFISSFGLSYIF